MDQMNGQDEHKADNARRTPEWLIEDVRALMGGITLDPASDYQAQKVVRAQHWYGPNNGPDSGGSWLGEDGLGPYAMWASRAVWLNPPGGYMPDRSSKAAAWWRALVESYLSGRTKQACFLAFSLNVFRTGQAARVSPYQFPFVVFRERIRFPGSDGSKGESPNVDSALVYLPPTEPGGQKTYEALQRFQDIFSKHGKVRI